MSPNRFPSPLRSWRGSREAHTRRAESSAQLVTRKTSTHTVAYRKRRNVTTDGRARKLRTRDRRGRATRRVLSDVPIRRFGRPQAPSEITRPVVRRVVKRFARDDGPAWCTPENVFASAAGGDIFSFVRTDHWSKIGKKRRDFFHVRKKRRRLFHRADVTCSLSGGLAQRDGISNVPRNGHRSRPLRTSRAQRRGSESRGLAKNYRRVLRESTRVYRLRPSARRR